MGAIRVRFKDALSLERFKSECGVNVEIGRILGLSPFEVHRRSDGYMVSQNYISTHIERYITDDEFEKYMEIVDCGEDSRRGGNPLDVTIEKSLTIKTQITKDNWEEVVSLLKKTFGG